MHFSQPEKKSIVRLIFRYQNPDYDYDLLRKTVGKRSEDKIKKLQRQLSKKVKSSNNRNKARIKLAKAFEHLANQRLDYIHFITNSLLKTYPYMQMPKAL